MRKTGLTIGIAALLLGLGAASIPLEPAYAQRNPCLGDGVSTQQEIDRRCAAARGVPYREPEQRPPRYERRDSYNRDRDYYARDRDDDYYGRRRAYRDYDYDRPRRGWSYDSDY